MVGSTLSELLVEVQKFKLMGKRLITDAQESVGGVKLLNLERKQHSYRSPHVVKVEWQVMRRE